MNWLAQFWRGFKKGMKGFGQSLSVIIDSILLSVVYFLGVGLTSLAARLFHKHFLDMRLSKRRKSYWSDLNLEKRPVEEYYRQF
jgi:hypothetical protein